MEDRKIMILLEGSICAGKTTIGRRAKATGLYDFVEEPVNQWENQVLEDPPDPNNPTVDLLGWFYEKMKERAFAFQINAFTTRAKNWTEILAITDHRKVILERSIFCDRYVFAKNCFQSGLMSVEEWTIYCGLWDFENSQSDRITEPNLTVYLRTPAEICYERKIKDPNRTAEKNIPLEYFQALEKLHDDWLLTENPKIIVLDGTLQWTPEAFIAEIENAILISEEQLDKRPNLFA